MQYRVFYSWQSDSPARDNRNFIEECLKRSIQCLRRDDVLDILLDRDTKNLPGMPVIGESVLEKIAAASIIVADLTIINPRREPGERSTCNPNVLFETGYALGSIGHKSMIGVFNTACGPIEDLPFDVRSRRVLPYNLEESPSRSSARDNLTMRLSNAIKLCLGETESLIAERNTEVHRRLQALWVLGTEIGEWSGVGSVADEIQRCRLLAEELPELIHKAKYSDVAITLSYQIFRSLNDASDLDLTDENWSDTVALVRSAGDKAKLIADHINLRIDDESHKVILRRVAALTTEIADSFSSRTEDTLPRTFDLLTRELREITFIRLLPQHPVFSRTLIDISRELRGVCIRWLKLPALREELVLAAENAISKLRDTCAKYKIDQ